MIIVLEIFVKLINQKETKNIVVIFCLTIISVYTIITLDRNLSSTFWVLFGKIWVPSGNLLGTRWVLFGYQMGTFWEKAKKNNC